MHEWRKIGDKGEELEKKWNNNLNKQNSKIKTNLKQYYINSDLDLEKIILKEKSKYFDSKPDLATRQCSSKTIESVSKFYSSINWRIC